MNKEKRNMWGLMHAQRCLGMKQHECVGGFYTVEAAFVMTIGILVVISLLYLAFYLHDVQTVQAERNCLLDQAAAEGWDQEQLEWELEQKMAGMELLVLDRTVSETVVKVERFAPEEILRKMEAVKEVVE